MTGTTTRAMTRARNASERGAPTTIETARSADGTTIGWERIGAGPALVVLHGGIRAGRHYRALAAAMAHRYSMLLVDRRGRGHSGPGRDDDGLEIEVADLAAVMAATGAERVFGHSAGAFIALEAAHRLPIRELSLYEPPVASPPLGWFPAFEAALARGKTARALALAIDGLGMGPRGLPAWVMALSVRVLQHTAEGKEATELVHTLPRDVATLRDLDGRHDRHAALGCRTLLLDGSASPAYLRRAVDSLAAVIPGARRVTLPRLSHNAPDMEAPERVAAELLAFHS
jgi:pimeloyl-ACP methyl ester carboxylesterase